MTDGQSALSELLKIAEDDKEKLPQVISHLAGLSGSSDGVALLSRSIDKVGPFLMSCYRLPSSSTKNLLEIKSNFCSTLANLLAMQSETENVDFSHVFSSLGSDSCIKRLVKDSFKEPDEREKLLQFQSVTLLGNATALSAQVCQSVADYALKPANQHLRLFDRLFAHSCDISELGNSFLCLLSNLTQLADFRTYLLSSGGKEVRLKILLPYLSFSPYPRRRQAVAAILKNCCFSTDHHSTLVGDELNVIPVLVLPLTSSEDCANITDEENEKMLPELRYLGDSSKKREELSPIRLNCVEALYQLCATKTGRQALRASNCYFVLREYHKWEQNTGKNDAIVSRLFDVIEILISDEQKEEKFDDLHKVEIPSDLAQQFDNDDKQVAPVGGKK